MKIAIIGAGRHSRQNHLPALARFARERPQSLVLAAVCDLSETEARGAAAEFGFQKAFTDIVEMLAIEKPDACIAITPVSATAAVAAQIIGKGIPLLMEKPLGGSIEEGKRIVELQEKAGVPVMVSLNRRFDPAVRAARDWIGGRPVDALRACMVRSGRREKRFFKDAGIHPVDTLRALGGEVASHSIIDRGPPGARSVAVGMRFESGARGLLEVYRESGHQAESYDVFGPDFHAAIRVGERDAGDAVCWANGQRELNFGIPEEEPDFYKNGAYHETCAFIDDLANGRPLAPSPRDAFPSMEICYQIDAALWEGGGRVVQ
jgi:predicted dehydrogenase